jgi:hypothetical protein
VSALEVDALVRSRHLWSFLSSIHAICAVVREPTSSVSAGEEASAVWGPRTHGLAESRRL